MRGHAREAQIIRRVPPGAWACVRRAFDFRHGAYQSLFGDRQLARAAPQSLTPADVTQRGLAGSDAFCAEALQTFCALLGSVAGKPGVDLGALAVSTSVAGIVPKLGTTFSLRFSANAFNPRSVHRLLSAIPTYVIHAQNPAFLALHCVGSAARRLTIEGFWQSRSSRNVTYGN